MDLVIPKHLKHYDFKRNIIEAYGWNYDDFLEEVRVKELHSKFLDKYNLDKYINWYF
jgi:hypothetical protein